MVAKKTMGGSRTKRTTNPLLRQKPLCGGKNSLSSPGTSTTTNEQHHFFLARLMPIFGPSGKFGDLPTFFFRARLMVIFGPSGKLGVPIEESKTPTDCSLLPDPGPSGPTCKISLTTSQTPNNVCGHSLAYYTTRGAELEGYATMGDGKGGPVRGTRVLWEDAHRLLLVAGCTCNG